jgi:GT2 family glycosyltransferase
MNKETIGIGVITYNRPHLLKKLLESINYRNDINLVIVNDGDKFECDGWNYYFINNETNFGVARSKNIALRHLLCKGCDHIFLIEDDIFVKNTLVFERYIEASKVTGIQHFNFSQHGRMNKSWPDSSPSPRAIINYGEITIPFYPHCVGAFSYYSRKCLETVGLIDERYYNACEHVDHTYEIIKAGMHPPFWYFADIENSWDFLGDEEWSIEKSTISSNPNHRQMMIDADKIFAEKHGHLPAQTPLVDTIRVGQSLKEIRNNYGRSNDSNL